MVPNDAILARLKELDAPYYISTIYDAATEEYKPKKEKDRCPLCGVALDETGVCPKCGYKKQ